MDTKVTFSIFGQKLFCWRKKKQYNCLMEENTSFLYPSKWNK
jgi:hypothetical protein